MPHENKLYLCFEYCEFDLKKYMKSQQYKLSAECIKVRHHPHAARPHARSHRRRRLVGRIARWRRGANQSKCMRPP